MLILLLFPISLVGQESQDSSKYPVQTYELSFGAFGGHDGDDLGGYFLGLGYRFQGDWWGRVGLMYDSYLYEYNHNGPGGYYDQRVLGLSVAVERNWFKGWFEFGTALNISIQRSVADQVNWYAPFYPYEVVFKTWQYGFGPELRAGFKIYNHLSFSLVYCGQISYGWTKVTETDPSENRRYEGHGWIMWRNAGFQLDLRF